MRFGEYVERVIQVFHAQKIVKTTADVLEAVESEEGHPANNEDSFNRALDEIKIALKANRGLLCVYGPEGRVTESEDEMKNKELKPEDMHSFLLKVRHDLCPKKPNESTDTNESVKPDKVSEIIAQVLEDLTKALEIKDFGCVFSDREQTNDDEKLHAETDNGEKVSRLPTRQTGLSASSPSGNTPTINEREYRALLLKLRAQGKIK